MKEKEMNSVLIKQILFETAILILAYLFIGNNFGNNIYTATRIPDNFHTRIEVLYSFAILAQPFILIFHLSPLWLTALFCFSLSINTEPKQYAKIFAGTDEWVALSVIKAWFKKSNKYYSFFIYASRILFVALLLLKAINAPTDYVIDFLIFKLKLSGHLLSILMVITGLFIAIFSGYKQKAKHNACKYTLKPYVCPICGKVSWDNEKTRTTIQEATYEEWESSSGYYTRDKVGEIVDSAGNHIGDVEGDVWVDTSSKYKTKLTPELYTLKTKYKPCGCVKSETKTE